MLCCWYIHIYNWYHFAELVSLSLNNTFLCCAFSELKGIFIWNSQFCSLLYFSFNPACHKTCSVAQCVSLVSTCQVLGVQAYTCTPVLWTVFLSCRFSLWKKLNVVWELSRVHHVRSLCFISLMSQCIREVGAVPAFCYCL